MKVIKNVQSTVQPHEMEIDEKHVYINTNIHVVPEEELPDSDDREGEAPTIYGFDVAEYDKDEYIVVQSEQNKQNSMILNAMLSGEVVNNG